MAEIPESISEIFRVLRPSGVAAISMQSGSAEGWRTGGTFPGRRYFNLVSPDRLSVLMDGCGYRELKYHNVGRAGWYLIYGVTSAADLKV